MKDTLEQFFSENEFDFHEPHTGHQRRFEKLLKGKNTNKKKSWRWMSVAASVILLIGFSLGSITQNKPLTLSDISPKMEEAEAYFVNTISIGTQEIEKNRSLQTEEIIEDALNQIEELEDHYQLFIKELNSTGEQIRVVNEMIKNYQKRLEILQNALQQIEQIKNPKTLENEIYI